MRQRLGSTFPPLEFGMRGVRFLRHLPDFVRLYWRLLWDSRVAIWPKALLVGSVLYVVSPVDFLPDFVPFFGRVDDLILVIAACRAFIRLCPPEVVRQHVQQIDAQRRGAAG